jgi:hypothetical protein
MFTINNDVQIGLWTELKNHKLYGHSIKEINSFTHKLYSRSYPYYEVALWYGKNKINTNNDSYMLIDERELNYYNVKINELPMTTVRKNKKTHSFKHRIHTYKSSSLSLGLNSIINDEKVLSENKDLKIAIKGRSANQIYKNLRIPQFDWDVGYRTRKGSWKDTKIRHQWQKHIKGNKLFSMKDNYRAHEINLDF